MLFSKSVLSTGVCQPGFVLHGKFVLCTDFWLLQAYLEVAPHTVYEILIKQLVFFVK